MTTVLITGATGGIGKAFAQAFAQQGRDVVLVARRGPELQALAAQLSADHGIEATPVVADLLDAQTRADLAAGYPDMDIVVNNAGFGALGKRFDEGDEQRIIDMVTLNCTAVADLSRRYLPTLVERRGTLINVASTAAFQPLPMWSLYAATKAFVLSLTEALWTEYKGTDVTIQCLCPGATETEFWEVAEAPEALPHRRTPQQVVESSLAGWAKNKPVVVDGAMNKVGTVAAKFAPYPLIERLAAKITK